MSECKCMRLAEAVKLAIGGHDMPHCELHDPAPPEPGAAPLALNDDDALVAAIGRAMGTSVHKTTL